MDQSDLPWVMVVQELELLPTATASRDIPDPGQLRTLLTPVFVHRRWPRVAKIFHGIPVKNRKPLDMPTIKLRTSDVSLIIPS